MNYLDYIHCNPCHIEKRRTVSSEKSLMDYDVLHYVILSLFNLSDPTHFIMKQTKIVDVSKYSAGIVHIQVKDCFLYLSQ